MDNPDNMERILETLRLETLKDIPLTRLSEAMKENLPADVDKKEVLDIYIMWLHLRLMVIDVSAKWHLGLEVFYLYHFLKALPGDDSRLADAFHDWQCYQAVGNSVISRKLKIAEAEFRKLAPAIQKKPSERNAETSMPEDRFGKMHPDRARLSRETRIAIEPGNDGDGGNDISATSNAGLGGRGASRRSRRSFLTGSNKLPVNDVSMVTHNINSEGPEPSKTQDEPVSKPTCQPKSKSKSRSKKKSKKKSKSKSATSAIPPESKGAETPEKPHEEYLCSRCETKGDHIFKDYAFLDPSLDKKPPKTYICQTCMKGGDHPISACSSNMDSGSMTQRRPASVKHNGRPSVERRDHPRESQPVEARNRSRSPPRELNKHIGKDAHDPSKEISSGSQTVAKKQPRKRKAPPQSPTPRKAGTQTWEIKGTLTVSPSFPKVKQPPEEVQLSYDDETDERHESDSRVTDRQRGIQVGETGGGLIASRNLKRKLVSYDDEVDETYESNSRVANHQRGAQVGDIGDSLTASRNLKRKLVSYDGEVDETYEGNSRVNDQQFKRAVLDLIGVESVKTDLLQLEPPSNPFLAFSLEAQNSLSRADETVDRPRPCAADFYDLRHDEEQPVETIDTGMAANTEAQEMCELTMALAGLANPATVEGEDAVMAELGPKTAVGVPIDAAPPAMLTTQSSHSEQSPITEARMGCSESGLMIQPINDGVLSAKHVAREAILTTMAEELNQVGKTSAFMDQFIAPGALEAKETEPLSPRPVNESFMEVEVTVTTAEELPATCDKPVKTGAGPGADTEMAEGQLSFVAEAPAAARGCDM